MSDVSRASTAVAGNAMLIARAAGASRLMYRRAIVCSSSAVGFSRACRRIPSLARLDYERVAGSRRDPSVDPRQSRARPSRPRLDCRKLTPSTPEGLEYDHISAHVPRSFPCWLVCQTCLVWTSSAVSQPPPWQ